MTSGLTKIGGEPVTWLNVRAWNEEAFRYDDITTHLTGDRVNDVLAMHRPPLFIVRFVRFENQPARTPRDET